MNQGAKTRCRHPGCSAVARAPYCAKHASQHGWSDPRRGTAAERGYGTAWRKLSELKRRRDPLCVNCERNGLVTPATCVDHIKPKSQGGTDDWANLQSLCDDCHRAKTQREANA